MLLPETKERERRFKLALRMGLPIFFLTLLLAVSTLSNYFERIPLSFYVSALVILAVMIYFFFYMLYAGLEERITDPVTGTFCREYLAESLQKELRRAPYTVMLVSLDNLNDINERYGVQNGDRVLREFVRWIGGFIEQKGIRNFPIGHFKGGDFFIGLPGFHHQYETLLDLLSLKGESYMVDEIEVQMSGALADSVFSTELDRLVNLLYERRQERRSSREEAEEEEISPSEMETAVIAAVREQRFSMMFQEVREGEERRFLEASVKLFGENRRLIHQKKYLPVISRLGLSRSFDLMLVEHLVKLCKRHSGVTGFALSLFPTTLRNLGFFKALQQLLQENPEAKGRLVLLLEEREHYTRTERFNELLQSYRKMGVRIVLDRLGKYQTTLRYLRELDVDMVRFDMYLGKELDDPKSRAIMQGLNLSVHEMGLKSWIRMIEEEQSAEIATSIGIDLLQGNYIGTISPLEAFTEQKS